MLATAGFFGIHTCLKIISLTCSQSLGLIKSITSYQSINHYDELNKLLLRTDMKQKIVKIQQMLSDIQPTKVKECIKTAIFDLHETIKNINTLLEECITINTNHKQLWFHAWRTVDMNQPINKLQIYNDILNQRFDDLVKLTTIVLYI